MFYLDLPAEVKLSTVVLVKYSLLFADKHGGFVPRGSSNFWCGFDLSGFIT